jgi:BolA protein
MSVKDRIREKITAELSPVTLDIIDQSEKHKGHAGHRPGGESHFDVSVVAAGFEGLNRVARQRRVYQILAEELAGPVHALSLDLKTPAEASK